MKDYLEGLLEGPLGLTNTMSHLGPILGRDSQELFGKTSNNKR